MDPIKGPLHERPDYLVCTCMGVMYSEILNEIQNGAKTFDDLQEKLLVGTGCSSCVSEIEGMLLQDSKK